VIVVIDYACSCRVGKIAGCEVRGAPRVRAILPTRRARNS
jgi:hypothetical protein